MSVDAFGYQTLTIREMTEAFGDITRASPAHLDLPVWVKGRHLFEPVKNILVLPNGRTIIEVHHG